MVIEIVKVANKKMRQARKNKCKRSKFSHSLLSLSFLSFFSSVKCFSFDFIGAALTLVQIKLNYLFRRKLYIGDPDVLDSIKSKRWKCGDLLYYNQRFFHFL